jgi:hypothetical protein
MYVHASMHIWSVAICMHVFVYVCMCVHVCIMCTCEEACMFVSMLVCFGVKAWNIALNIPVLESDIEITANSLALVQELYSYLGSLEQPDTHCSPPNHILLSFLSVLCVSFFPRLLASRRISVHIPGFFFLSVHFAYTIIWSWCFKFQNYRVPIQTTSNQLAPSHDFSSRLLPCHNILVFLFTLLYLSMTGWWWWCNDAPTSDDEIYGHQIILWMAYWTPASFWSE